MQILLEADCLIQALNNMSDSVILNLCRQKRCHGWVASTSIPVVLEQEGVSEKDIQSILQVLAVLTPTAHDINMALQSNRMSIC